MTDVKEFKLPDVGEGLTEADIVAWHVKPGDQVEDGQTIVEIETAKAVVELPCPWDGTVARLLAEEGQTVDVGVPIIAVEVARQAAPDSAERAPVPAPVPAESTPDDEAGAAFGPGGLRGQDLGHHPRAHAGPRPGARIRPRCPPRPRYRPSRRKCPPSRASPWPRTLAKPPVRKLAKDLGISLAELAGSGPDGSITRDDVQRAAAADTRVRSAESGNGSRTATLLRSPAARSASRSGAYASTWPRPWCRARSPPRTSPSSSRST